MNLPTAPTAIGRVCIDLDNTLARSNWPSPEIGEPIDTGVNVLLSAVEAGYEVIIYTARPASHSARIWEWLKEHGFYGDVYDVVTGKPTADLYVDDKAYNPFIGVGDGETPSAHLEAPTMALGVETAGDVRAGERPASSWREGAADPASALGSDVVESGPPSNYGGPIGEWGGVPVWVDDTLGVTQVRHSYDEDEPDDGWIQRMLKGVWG